MIRMEDEDFKELAEGYNEALDYIRFLESKLDKSIYQDEEYNKKFAGNTDETPKV